MDIYPHGTPDHLFIILHLFFCYKNHKVLESPWLAWTRFRGEKVQTSQNGTWHGGPISKHDTPCTGGADDYLKLLLDEIMPEAEALLPGAPAWRGLAGYSLAGLFALYALYQTDVFARAASMSGSFWFDGIMEYVCSHEMKRKPDCLYFSLGDKESSTDNPILNVVQQNTQEIETLCHGKGIETTFVLNSGSHYQACNKRTAAGIHWILNR